MAERNNAGSGPEGTEQVVNGDPEEHEALGMFDIDEPVFEDKGKLHGNCIRGMEDAS